MASYLTLDFDLGKPFLSQLKKLANEEFEISQSKWGVTLDNETKKTVLMLSFEQLKAKVSAITRHQWNLEQNIKFDIAKGYGEITIPSEAANASTLHFVRINDGWIIDPECTEYSTPLCDFPLVAASEIKDWIKTAVFYSVGSYKIT